jgi:hypothetical protein
MVCPFLCVARNLHGAAAHGKPAQPRAEQHAEEYRAFRGVFAYPLRDRARKARHRLASDAAMQYRAAKDLPIRLKEFSWPEPSWRVSPTDLRCRTCPRTSG